MKLDTHRTHTVKQWLFDYQALLFVIVAAALILLIPHPDNITPLAAIGLFAGAYLDRRIFLLVPVIAALLSDLAGPGNYGLFIMATVYAGLLLSSLSGRLVLHRQRKFARLPVAILASAVGFYLVSNIGAWWAFYEHSPSGLLACYINGLPYLGRTIAGDAVYSVILFGGYEAILLSQRRHFANA